MSKAYRRALGKFHPDRQRNKPLPEQLEAEEKFKLLRRCYESYCASGVNNGRSPSGRSEAEELTRRSFWELSTSDSKLRSRFPRSSEFLRPPNRAAPATTKGRSSGPITGRVMRR